MRGPFARARRRALLTPEDLPEVTCLSALPTSRSREPAPQGAQPKKKGKGKGKGKKK